MTGLNREDGSGNGEVGTVVDVLSGTGICGDTDVLDQSGERDEGLDVSVGAKLSALSLGYSEIVRHTKSRCTPG
jgi:hypothetical protein